MAITTTDGVDPSSATAARPIARPRLAVALSLLALLVVTALAYWPGVHGGFVFDDYQNIVENPAFASSFAHWRDWVAAAVSSPASALQRPLAMLTVAANVRFAGLDPAAMKLTNIGIHLLNVVLVFLLVRALLRSAATSRGNTGARNDWLALFAAAAWGLHPIHLMAVLYVVQRMESLAHLFVFAGLWLYVLGRQRQIAGRNGWWLVAGGLLGGMALGTLSKESAVLLPVYAFGLELFVFHFHGAGERRSRYLVALYVVVLLLPALAALAWQLPLALRPGAYAWREFTLGERLLTEARVVLQYLRWILLPDLRALGLYHDDVRISHGLLDPPATLAALLAIPTLLGLAWWQRRRLPLTALGLYWFFAAQLLTATVIPLELVFEHRNYFAALGVSLLLTELLLLALPEGGRRIGVALAGAFLLFCAGTTWLRADEWSSPARFASSEAARHPRSARATYEYARALIIAGRYDPHSPLNPAIVAALDKAQHAPGSGALPEQAALIFAARTGAMQADATWARLQDKLRRRPFGPEEQLSLIALSNCAVDDLCRFPPDRMLATFAAALERRQDPRVLSIFGKYALYVLRDTGLGLRLWREAAKGEPRNAQFQVNLIALLIDLGQLDEARAHIATLRALGRLGQYGAVADELQQRLDRRVAGSAAATARSRP